MWSAEIFLERDFTYTGLAQHTTSVAALLQCCFLADLISYLEHFKMQSLNLLPM